jgi:predicted O-methyltransferase YrrM
MEFDLADVLALADNCAFGPTGDPFLDARWDAHVAQFGHGVPYWRFFHQLCQALEPGLAVELGAWQATCAAHMAAGGAATVATIDHHSDPGDDVNERLSLEAAQRYAGLFYLKGWTWDRVDDVRALGKPIDLLFIDSWHQYDYARRDWETYAPLLATPALVACDDLIVGDFATIAGMQRFWSEISGGRERFVSRRIHPGFPVGFFKWTG